MRFWSKKVEAKSAPPIGTSIYVAGTSGASWMKQDRYAIEGYAENPIAYACISKIAASVGSLQYKVMSYAGKEPVEIDNSPLHDLLDAPNDTQDWSAFMGALVSHYLINGNAYVLKLPLDSAKPVQLWLLRPERMRIHHDAKGAVTHYEYNAGAGSIKYQYDAVTGACDVKHISAFNPNDDYIGLSAMSPAAKAVDIVNEAMTWNKSLLENGARPSGAYVVTTEANGTGKLTDEQFTRLREQMRKNSQGSKNAGESMLLEGGLDWKEMSLSPKDMDFENNMWAAARMIATAYGVPPQLVNVRGESTYSNYAEAKIAFWQDTVIPLSKRLFGQLGSWLCPAYGKDLFLEVDEDRIDAMEEKRWMKYDRLERVSFLTANEKRIAVGMDAVDGGDVLLTDSGKVPLSILSDSADV